MASRLFFVSDGDYNFLSESESNKKKKKTSKNTQEIFPPGPEKPWRRRFSGSHFMVIFTAFSFINPCSEIELRCFWSTLLSRAGKTSFSSFPRSDNSNGHRFHLGWGDLGGKAGAKMTPSQGGDRGMCYFLLLVTAWNQFPGKRFGGCSQNGADRGLDQNDTGNHVLNSLV